MMHCPGPVAVRPRRALAWDADGKGFIYVRFPPPASGAEVQQFHAALAHHTLGRAAKDDPVVFGKDFSAIAEYRLLASPDRQTLAVLANHGDGGPADIYLRHDGQWRKIMAPAAMCVEPHGWGRDWP